MAEAPTHELATEVVDRLVTVVDSGARRHQRFRQALAFSPMCGIIGVTGAADPYGRCSTASPSRVPRLRLGRHRPRRRRRPLAKARRRPGPLARCARGGRLGGAGRTASRASATPAGRPTARRSSTTPIPTSTAPAASPSSTTASSRTTASSARSSQPRAIPAPPRPTREVVAHLLERELATGVSLAEALRRCVVELRGDFALAAVSSHEPDVIVAARRTSPLILGQIEGMGLVASDISALLGTTRTLFQLVGRRDRRGPARLDLRRRARRHQARASAPRGRLGSRRGPPRRLRRLHVEGDPRAAESARGHVHRAGCTPTARPSSRSSSLSERRARRDRPGGPRSAAARPTTPV